MPGARIGSTPKRRAEADEKFQKVFQRDHVQLARVLQIDQDAITAINTRKALCALGRRHPSIMRFLPAIGRMLRREIAHQQCLTVGNRGRPNDPRYIGQGPVQALSRVLDSQYLEHSGLLYEPRVQISRFAPWREQDATQFMSMQRSIDNLIPLDLAGEQERRLWKNRLPYIGHFDIGIPMQELKTKILSQWQDPRTRKDASVVLNNQNLQPSDDAQSRKTQKHKGQQALDTLMHGDGRLVAAEGEVIAVNNLFIPWTYQQDFPRRIEERGPDTALTPYTYHFGNLNLLSCMVHQDGNFTDLHIGS